MNIKKLIGKYVFLSDPNNHLVEEHGEMKPTYVTSIDHAENRALCIVNKYTLIEYSWIEKVLKSMK